MSKATCAVAFSTLFLLQGVANAQSPAGAARWFVPGAAYGAYGGGYGGGYGYGGYGASTAPQGYMDGMSQVIRSRGAASVDYSQARINNQQAASSYLDNQQKWFDYYHQRKDRGKQMMAAQAAEQKAAAQRYVAHEKSGFPPRLTASQLDPVTGQINWPEALKADMFADSRKKIEDLASVMHVAGSTVDFDKEFHDAAHEMLSQLKTTVRDTPTFEYVAARQFLESLAFEGRYLPQ